MQIGRQKITPCLWFDNQAEDAANFYVSVFKNGKIGRISRYSKAGHEIHGRTAGSVMTVEFEIDGQPFTAADVIYSYTRARDVPGSVATFAGYLRTIDTMSAPDPLTLVVKTRIPNPDLPLNLASVHIVSKHVGEKSNTDDYNTERAVIEHTT